MMPHPQRVAVLVDRAERIAVAERWPIASLSREQLRRLLAEALLRQEREPER